MPCEDLRALARMLDGLAHELRLRIIALLYRRGEMYLSEIASELGISRALAKIHLKKLESAGIVESRVMLEPGKAQAKRYYRLRWRGTLTLSPEDVARIALSGEGNECGGGKESG